MYKWRQVSTREREDEQKHRPPGEKKTFEAENKSLSEQLEQVQAGLLITLGFK